MTKEKRYWKNTWIQRC